MSCWFPSLTLEGWFPQLRINRLAKEAEDAKAKIVKEESVTRTRRRSTKVVTGKACFPATDLTLTKAGQALQVTALKILMTPDMVALSIGQWPSGGGLFKIC